MLLLADVRSNICGHANHPEWSRRASSSFDSATNSQRTHSSHVESDTFTHTPARLHVCRTSTRLTRSRNVPVSTVLSHVQTDLEIQEIFSSTSRLQDCRYQVSTCSAYVLTKIRLIPFSRSLCSGSTTPMPTLFEFNDMFSAVPFPNEDTLLPPPPVQRAPGSGPAPKPPRQPRAPPPTAKPLPPPTRLEKFFSKVPLIPTYFPNLCQKKNNNSRKSQRDLMKNKGPSPYPRLKTGRRSILVAVVSDGTSSILRFSETEFAKLPWKGQGRYA
jgi:hypothetical protein